MVVEIQSCGRPLFGNPELHTILLALLAQRLTVTLTLLSTSTSTTSELLWHSFVTAILTMILYLLTHSRLDELPAELGSTGPPEKRGSVQLDRVAARCLNTRLLGTR